MRKKKFSHAADYALIFEIHPDKSCPACIKRLLMWRAAFYLLILWCRDIANRLQLSMLLNSHMICRNNTNIIMFKHALDNLKPRIFSRFHKTLWKLFLQWRAVIGYAIIMLTRCLACAYTLSVGEKIVNCKTILGQLLIYTHIESTKIIDGCTWCI